MQIARRIPELKSFVDNAIKNNKTIGLVPTMGALHEGHLSLITRARKENDIVVVSVFVNPTQFNNPEDLKTYPRTEHADCKLLERAGVDMAFIPTAEEIYPEPDNRIFDLGDVATVMEGAMRPGHFNGVAQIVSKLFEWARPTRAYFGEKDFQQIAVIRRMARISGFENIDIVACPIVREADGLALSSRNVRLTPENRAIAPEIHRALKDSLNMTSELTVDQLIESVTKRINSFDCLEVEYFSIVDPLSMQPVKAWTDVPNPVGCITVYCGDVRLIDNICYRS